MTEDEIEELHETFKRWGDKMYETFERWGDEMYERENEHLSLEEYAEKSGEKWVIEEPVPFGKYANERYPQIPCLVDIKNYGYGIRYWNVKEKCWDNESCDDYYCDMDKIKKWAYLKYL